ncbi:serine hydrolase [Bradyrhizobium sp. BR13661]|jgi:CubicO group peptidase (beta-lactamase class C family)|uniref:serine hydrolase domain-containing protein n=1 Tax=Bradyrhizobium sp. BR13661 TaxID=2940622 RepID=UPI0024768A20|nr:serine hydrolase [Bradyrhizobium sp. BR13661]MDH6263737.1 CubicO group peptidase (beta-lactamase class C family) [Bradyrhizobium sp. BR13661]
MRIWTCVVTAVCAVAFCAVALGPVGAEPASACGIPQDIHDGWVMTVPEKQGLNTALLCAMDEGISGGKLANVDDIVVIRHGVLVFERYYDYPHQMNYDATTRHNGYSMTKSVVSLLVGVAMDRGLIKDLDAPISSYLPDYAGLRAWDKDRMTLRHLLTMSAGLGTERALGVSFQYDNVSFQYNNAETELIGTILKKVTGKGVDVLAQENIFAPLGIEDVAWYRNPVSGLPTSSYGLSLRPRDWAKIGQLVLNRGAWDGKQIVSASWIERSTAEHIKTDKAAFGYGYQWWIGHSPDSTGTIEWAAALGFNSQKTIIIPSLDMVVVFNAGRESKNMVAPELDLLDRYILPATLRN